MINWLIPVIFSVFLAIAIVPLNQSYSDTGEIIISDKKSCEEHDGAWSNGACFFENLTIPDGQSWTVTEILIVENYLKNEGFLKTNSETLVSNLINKGTFLTGPLHTNYLLNECEGIIEFSSSSSWNISYEAKNNGIIKGESTNKIAGFSNASFLNSGSILGGILFSGLNLQNIQNPCSNGNSSQEIMEDIFIQEKNPQIKNSFSSSTKQNTMTPPPTFGMSHYNLKVQTVENGFSFNDQLFPINDNYHTQFVEQPVVIGAVNTFSATVFAEKKLKVQEFLFGIPEVGKAHLAELGVEVWYDLDGNIEDVIVVQKSDVIDADTVKVTHEKSNCLDSDPEPLCDTTKVPMTFLEPLKDKVMAIKAIDYKNRYQITYLNEGVNVAGESVNPMKEMMIPSLIKGEGLLKVTQTAKYSPYWKTDDDRLFEMNRFGSFKQINHEFERFQDTGTAYTRLHSGFGGIIAYEQQRAQNVFDASMHSSDVSESFAYNFPESDSRISDDLRQQMLLQEEIAKKILEESRVQARW